MQFHDALLPILFWALAIYLCRPSMLKKEDWRDRRVLGTRVFVIGMAVSLTIQAHPIGAIFDSIIGLNNFSWFVGYGDAVVAVYAGTSALFIVRDKSLPTWLTIASLVTLGVFVLLAPFLVLTPEEIHSKLPRSVPLVLLREALYVFIFLVSIACIRMFRGWVKEETHPTGRLRGSLLLAGFTFTLVFSVVRGAVAFAAFLVPEWSWHEVTLKGSDLLLLISVVITVLGIAPLAWLRIPIRMANYIEQQRALRDLHHVRHSLVAITGDVPWAQPVPSDRWFNLPFVLYCACIDILDRRMLLHAQLNDNKNLITSEHIRIAKSLEHLPETPDWVELVQHLRVVAREI